MSGYPVELGLANLAARWVRAWLIRPEPGWTALAWSPASEAIHGLSRATLAAGTSAHEVAAALSERAGDGWLVSENPAFDQRWLARLFDGTDLPVLPIAAEPLAPAIAARAHQSGRTSIELAALNRARHHRTTHRAAHMAAGWAATAEGAAFEGVLQPQTIDTLFDGWMALAAAAAPWRRR